MSDIQDSRDELLRAASPFVSVLQHDLALIEDEFDSRLTAYLQNSCDDYAMEFTCMRAAVRLRRVIPVGAHLQRMADINHLVEQTESGLIPPSVQALQFALTWTGSRRRALHEDWEPRTDLATAVDLLLTRLLRTTSEISVLLQYAYSGAAFGRWRTLHEAAVTLRLFSQVVGEQLSAHPDHGLGHLDGWELADLMADEMLLQGAAEEVQDAERLAHLSIGDLSLEGRATQALEVARMRLATQIRGRNLDPSPGRHWVGFLEKPGSKGRVSVPFANTARVVLGYPIGSKAEEKAAFDDAPLDGAADSLLRDQRVLYPIACSDLHVSGQVVTSELERLAAAVSVDQTAAITLRTFRRGTADALRLLRQARSGGAEGASAGQWESVLTELVLKEAEDCVSDDQVWQQDVG